nr:hypothetical protein CFP56_69366 [Quercus suber]
MLSFWLLLLERLFLARNLSIRLQRSRNRRGPNDDDHNMLSIVSISAAKPKAVVSADEPITYSGVDLFALPIIVAYQSTDVSMLSVASSTGDFSSSSFGGKTGLSAGTQAGIAVGVIVGVILILVGGLLLLRQRRKKRASANSSDINEKAELPGEGKDHAELEPASMNPEMDVDGARHEVGGGAKPGELDGSHANSRAELDGGWMGEEAPVTQNPLK